MDVPEDVEIHLENNPAWSESVKNEKRRILGKTGQAVVSETASPKRQALSVDKSRQDPERRTQGVDKTRQVQGRTVNETRGKCQLGAETKGTPGKTHESLYSSSPKGNYRKTLGEGCSSRAPEKKATADLMSTNHGKVEKTESRSGESQPKIWRGSDYQDQRISELFSLVNTLTEDLKMTREELDKERKERKRERQDQSLREEMLNERIEKLEQERKRRR